MTLLGCFSPEFRERHLEAPHSGTLVAVDTFFVGALKAVNNVHPQTVIDCFSRSALAHLYANKQPLTSARVLNNDVLPDFEQHATTIDAVLSSNGPAFCGRGEGHHYELFLHTS